MGSEAIELFDRMPGDLINDRTHVCVLNACSHSGLLNQARQIFANAPKKTEMIYTTMVSETFIRSITLSDQNRWTVVVVQLRLTKPKSFSNDTKLNIHHHCRCTVSLFYDRFTSNKKDLRLDRVLVQ